jgi:hypothetical protein
MDIERYVRLSTEASGVPLKLTDSHVLVEVGWLVTSI